MPRIQIIRQELAVYEPALAELPQPPALEAAVSLVLHAGESGRPSLLFIERAESERDPWSGQMAFPGGRYEDWDPDLQATAARETQEEVGLELGEPLGRLDDVVGGRGPDRHVVVSPYVYELAERPDLSPNYEVSATVWIPLPWILNPDSATEHSFQHGELHGRFPAFQYEGYTVWGLTYRILRNFFDLLGSALPLDKGGETWDHQPE